MLPRKHLLTFLYFLPSIALVYYFSRQWRHFQLDDALIYLRYIKNFQNGYGLVYNPGEKFNGLTSPLFSYLMVAGSFLTTKLLSLSTIVSAVFLAGTGFFAGRVLCETEPGKAFTSIMVVSFGFFYSTFGMETTLFMMLIVLSLYLYRIQSDYFVLTLALLISTRSEGIFLAAPMAADYLFRYRRLPNLAISAAGVMILAAPFLVNTLYYGAPLPATGDAKIGQGRSGFWGTGWIFFDIAYLYGAIFSENMYSVGLLALLTAYGAFLSIRNRIAIIFIIFAILLLAFYGGLNIPNYHWYYAPFLLFALVFSGFGIENVFRHLWKYRWPSDPTFLSLVLATLIGWLYVQTIAPTGGKRNEAYATIGQWLKEHTAPDASVAMVEIGTIGWYADRKVIDILGLTNKYNAGFIAKGDTISWIGKYQPDYILRHDPPWPFEQAASALERQGMYEPAPGFRMPGFVLLKKSSAFTDAQIADLPAKLQQDAALMSSMLRAAKLRPPLVQLDPDGLFAHAPAELVLTLPQAAQTLSFSYGVRAGAQGKHHGICFEVSNKGGTALFHDCIAPDAPTADMKRSARIDIQGAAGDPFTFRTICQGGCDYGWSLWGDIALQ